MSLSIKSGVRVFGLRPEIILAIVVAEGAYREAGVDLTITSGIDGKHMLGSFHYSGSAVDLRTNGLPEEKKEPLRKTIAERLGQDYDVLFEGDHIHCEFQPKQPYGATS